MLRAIYCGIECAEALLGGRQRVAANGAIHQNQKAPLQPQRPENGGSYEVGFLPNGAIRYGLHGLHGLRENELWVLGNASRVTLVVGVKRTFRTEAGRNSDQGEHK